jgi:hypothetical protein
LAASVNRYFVRLRYTKDVGSLVGQLARLGRRFGTRRDT